ncbi:MAG: hypothetical protein QW092_02450 [Candidatus Korarchaeum sp.]
MRTGFAGGGEAALPQNCEGDLVKLFSALKRFSEIHGPVRTGRFYVFKEVSSVDEMSLNYTHTMIPSKKYFIKPRERNSRD